MRITHNGGENDLSRYNRISYSELSKIQSHLGIEVKKIGQHLFFEFKAHHISD